MRQIAASTIAVTTIILGLMGSPKNTRLSTTANIGDALRIISVCATLVKVRALMKLTELPVKRSVIKIPFRPVFLMIENVSLRYLTKVTA